MLIAIRGNKRRAESLVKNESTGRTGSCSGTLIIATFSVTPLLHNHRCRSASGGCSGKGLGQDE